MVLQFTVKHEQKIDCGGGYAKVCECVRACVRACEHVYERACVCVCVCVCACACMLPLIIYYC